MLLFFISLILLPWHPLPIIQLEHRVVFLTVLYFTPHPRVFIFYYWTCLLQSPPTTSLSTFVHLHVSHWVDGFSLSKSWVFSKKWRRRTCSVPKIRAIDSNRYPDVLVSHQISCIVWFEFHNIQTTETVCKGYFFEHKTSIQPSLFSLLI